MGQLLRDLSTYYENALNKRDNIDLSKSIVAFSESSSVDQEIVPQYSLQNKIRPLFGKTGFNPPMIGNHPDFNYLAGTNNSEFHSITTLFMDIENSTRFNLLYEPKEVQHIKNTFICTAIELIKAFDGHVHRIMGDAVMAFFGGKNTMDEDNIINALNCSSVLQYFSEKIVRPRLNYDDPFGIRIGVDYGPKDKVLWSSYGYYGMNEVTATSFFVDVASKLQHQAGRNNVMIGDSLKSFIDLPEDILNIKMDSAGNKDYYIKPNFTDKNGKSIFYKKYLFDWERYLDLSIIPQEEGAFISKDSTKVPFYISTSVYNNDQFVSNYFPIGNALKKHMGLRFKIRLPKELIYPYQLKFIVENHGEDARILGGPTLGNHETKYEISELDTYENINHCEHTAYRGLHYMNVQLIKNGAIQNQTKVGVFIQ